MEKPIILVPTDFTKVGDNALIHAMRIAESANAEIHVLHVVGQNSEVEEARTKLRIYKEKVKEKFNRDIFTIARIGSIFEDIPDVCSELGASMIVMGTHGLRGMQFVLGGRALRIVAGSPVPFIIVQEKEISSTGYNNILVPLDLHKETKQKLNVVADMAKYFNSKVHLIIPNEKDEFLKNQLSRNLNFAENYFSENEIEFTAKVSHASSSEFIEGIFDYAPEVNADLVAIMNIDGSNIFTLPANNYVQRIITNERHIPVLVMNPKNITHINALSAYEGRG